MAADIEMAYPPVGAWVWGSQGVAYQVARRFKRGDRKFLALVTQSGLVDVPIERVAGWQHHQPVDPTVLAVILADCRHRGDLEAVKQHYGEDQVKRAWSALPVAEKQRLWEVAQLAPPPDLEIPADFPFVVGERVIELDSQRLGTVLAVRFLPTSTQPMLVVQHDDGSQACGDSSNWNNLSISDVKYQCE